MSLEGLEGLIKGLENQESWQTQKQFRSVIQHWPKSVGFAVARKARPISIQRGTLYVATATAVWAQTLAYERLKILKKLNRYQRQPIKNIRFSSAQWTQTAPNQPSPKGSTQHPSYIGEVPKLPGLTDHNPNKAFRQWAEAMQQMQLSQPNCPHCHSPCPQGELDRWAICALCATKQW
ncbi:MAG: DUF721 domain-containing protein [Phormidesmis sp.]